MSKTCNTCGGLIMASNEVTGYGGAICSGIHQATGIDKPVTSSGDIDYLQEIPTNKRKGII